MVFEIQAYSQNCHIWAWNLPIGQSSRSWRSTPFLSQGVEIELIFASRAAVPRYGSIFTLAIFGHETCPLVKVPEVAYILPFYPRESKLSLFLLYGHSVRDTGRFSKLPYLSMTLCHWPKTSPRSCTFWLFVEIELIFTLRAAVSEIWAVFQNCHIWAWNLAIDRSSRICTYTQFLPQRVEIEVIFDAKATVKQREHILP